MTGFGIFAAILGVVDPFARSIVLICIVACLWDLYLRADFGRHP